MTLYRAILRFTAGGPAVTGAWEDNGAVARRTYKHGSGRAAVTSRERLAVLRPGTGC
ncbi:hypothetical protein [Streptomyces sp. NPDC002324]